ncbi:MAG: CopD family protein [Candidatus Methylomirabilia bacterium]
MRLLALWLHLLAAVVWLGGLLFQSHILLPILKGSGRGTFGARVLRRARPLTWGAVVLVVVTGFYNLTRLGLNVLTETSVGTLLAVKIFAVIVGLMLLAHRDFGLVARLARELDSGRDGARELRAIAWLDRVVILLGAAVLYLGLSISRGV